jgi:predicted translin family RNA/ssDNA-binding protein
VTPEDYVLGMSDLTGELMRYATNGEYEGSLEEIALKPSSKYW